MEDRIDTVKKAFNELAADNKKITLQQLKETSGIDDPENEIEVLRKKGVIMQIKKDEFKMV